MVFHFDYSAESLEKRSKVFGRLIVLCLILLLVINVQGQTNNNSDSSTVGWDNISPETTTDFNDILTLDRESSIIVGNDGEIYYSIDNGTTWIADESGTASDLLVIDNEENVTVIGGASGTLLLNSSTGWTDISPTTVNIHAIDIALVNENNTIIYIAGANGEIWKTIDAGNNWNQLTSSTSEQINDISFYNETHGLAAGTNGLLIGTLDGSSWQPRDIPENVTSIDFNAIEFYSPIRAFAVGDNGIFLRSDISDTPLTGFTWQNWNTGTEEDLFDLDATSSNKIYVVGSNATILLTKDGGNVFNFQKTNVTSFDIKAIDMADGFYGYVTGENGIVLFTDREGIAEDELPSVRDFSDFSVYWEETFPFIIEGFINMLKIIFLSMLFGFILGISLAVGKTVEFKPINFVSTIYTDFFRNTPLLVQIFVIHFGFPELGIDLTFGGLIESRAFASSLISLSLNSGAYQAEIIRSGIQAIPTGQMEAGRSVGLSYGQTMRYIILPQAIRVVIPPLGNEFVNLTLNSSLTSVTGYFELTRAGRIIIAITFLNFQTWIIIALFYFIITYTLTNILRYAEKKTKIPGLGMAGGA